MGRVLLSANVELVQRHRAYCSQAPWIGADLVHGEQRVVAIKRGVLETFGRDWAGELLPAHDETGACFSLLRWHIEQ